MSTRPNWKQINQTSAQRQRRRAGGWKAKRAGESTEELVMQVGRMYLQHERAEIRKRPEPYRRIGGARPNGQFTAAPLSKSGPDFDVALPDGRAGLIEVKSRKGHRIPLSAVGDIQYQALARRVHWHGFGMILVMLWKEGQETRWWAIDCRRWNEAKKKGYKSLSDQDLDLLGVRCELLVGHKPDWLPALLKADQEAKINLWPLDED